MALAALLLTAGTSALADVPRSLSAYVKARAADGDGRVEAASAAYAVALAAAPDNPVVAVRAYREALQAGDLALARASAGVMIKAGIAPPDTAVLAAADAIHAGDWAAANAAADRMAGGPLEFLGPVLKAWSAFEHGDREAARLLAGESKNALARRFNAENRALLLIAGGKPDEGVAELRALLGAGSGSLDLRVNAAQLLAGAGRLDTARALLVGDDPVMAQLAPRLGNAPLPTAAYGASRLFTRLAAEIVQGDARSLAIALGRAALVLDPADDRARLVLADALSNDGAHARATVLLDQVRPQSIYYAPALAAKVTVLTRAGDSKRALAAAGAIAKGEAASVQDFMRYGDLLVAAARYDDAAKAYEGAMARAGDKPSWMLYLQRGGALEQAGRWREAKPLLERAVALAPEEAVALNYLGYAQLDRGEDVAAARALLERAARLAPEDPAIADSLGWAYFRSGQPARALPLLERAARAQPADVTIQEHLGDVYWHAGRRYEARYAWRAAAIYADAKDAERLAGKIGSGLLAR